MVNRSKFDLAISFNGQNNKAHPLLDKAKPDLLFFRPNIGFDIGAFDHAIQKAPSYPHYILLHDDHWFIDPQWFDKLTCLSKQQDAFTLLGNLTYAPGYLKGRLQEAFGDLSNGRHPLQTQLCCMNGLAGAFPRRAIEFFLNIGGLPHANAASKEEATYEEILSGLLPGLHGFNLCQIPPGFDLFLIHGAPTHLCHAQPTKSTVEVSIQTMENDFTNQCHLMLQEFLEKKLNLSPQKALCIP